MTLLAESLELAELKQVEAAMELSKGPLAQPAGRWFVSVRSKSELTLKLSAVFLLVVTLSESILLLLLVDSELSPLVILSDLFESTPLALLSVESVLDFDDAAEFSSSYR